MGLTADRLAKLELVDEVLREPLGGAHRDPDAMSRTLREALERHLTELERVTPEALREQRNQKIASFGVYSEA
jgi:acetyl-CoA carboxylase carboxyl transferase subunit alpha